MSDVVASALVIHFIPDRAKAFVEMKRVLRPGGLVGGYRPGCWHIYVVGENEVSFEIR